MDVSVYVWQLIRNFHGQMETFKESAALKIAEARKLVWESENVHTSLHVIT